MLRLTRRITEEERRLLRLMCNHNVLATRARIVFLAEEGRAIAAIADYLQITGKTARKWFRLAQPPSNRRPSARPRSPASMCR